MAIGGPCGPSWALAGISPLKSRSCDQYVKCSKAGSGAATVGEQQFERLRAAQLRRGNRPLNRPA